MSLDFLKVLNFFSLVYAIVKDFSYLFGAKFSGQKFSTGDTLAIDQ